MHFENKYDECDIFLSEPFLYCTKSSSLAL